MSTDSNAQPHSLTEIPKDIIESADVTNTDNIDDQNILMNYFIESDGSTVLKKWSHMFQEDKNKAFRELVILIFQLGGHRMDISQAQIESLALDIILPEYQDYIETNASKKPPLTTYTQARNNKVPIFWSEISKQIISTQASFCEQFVNYRQWLTSLSLCKIRILRLSAVYAAIGLFTQMTQCLSNADKDINRLKKVEKPSDAVRSKLSELMNEKRVYNATAAHIFNTILSKSVRDTEPQIRGLAVSAIAAGAANADAFADENHTRYIEQVLKDAVWKNRQAALKALETVFENTERDTWSGLAERVTSTVIELCSDQENGVVDAALKVLIIMDADVSNEILENVSGLLADASQSIRIAASKFVCSKFFPETAPIEDELQSLLKLSTQFTAGELEAAISVLESRVRVLREWNLLCDSIGSAQDEAVAQQLSLILLVSAEAAAGRLLCDRMDDETIRDMSVSLVTNLPKLLPAFPTSPQTQANLIMSARTVDLDAVEECASDRSFPETVARIREAFLESSDPIVFDAAASVLYELTQGGHQLNATARSELDRLAVGCGDISTGDAKTAISKFLSAARFVNMSDSDSVRSFLFEAVSGEGDREDALKCLDLFFQWDVLKLKRNPEDVPEYAEMFGRFANAFRKCLDGSDREREASIRGLSSMFCLRAMLANADYTHALDECIDDYMRSFHLLTEKLRSEVFEVASRPASWRAIGIKYLAHFMAYAGDESLKEKVAQLWSDTKRFAPFGGGAVPEALSMMVDAGCGDTMLIAGARFMSRRFRAFDAAKRYFENEIDKRIAVPMASIFTSLRANEAQHIECTPEFDSIFGKLRAGEKPTQGMLNALRKATRLGDDEGGDADDSDEPDGTFVS